MTGPGAEELVVLLDESGNACGTAPKATVHHAGTPLHLAFSCYLFDHQDALLLTRRALHKPTWPGAWTNSVCGHPLPGESMVDAVRRRVHEELGVVLDEVQLALPAFRYEAVMDNGVRENEMCPVFVAVTGSTVRPAADEVADVEWVPWEQFRSEVTTGEREVSPWCREQVVLLAEQQDMQGTMGAGDWDRLPPAALR